eukprot:CAMPEP_0178912730 /NCGR_PEP_ID=MMETSP0786-20121207/10436_1 /TAXON_ID=186022 /ORGANISM="Thalassionema frauenfeldii, Strain CCMP 1798" /LENGTH=153 /DNA_ID=CAMNT_0020585367 /DNA_START=194 /DNA_END=652 /DNA_ORIENTATION=+
MKTDAGWKNPPKSVSPSAKNRREKGDKGKHPIKTTCNNRYAALSDDDNDRETSEKKNWLSDEFPPIAKAVNKVKVAAKALEEFAAGKNDYDEGGKSLYENKDMDEFECKNYNSEEEKKDKKIEEDKFFQRLRIAPQANKNKTSTKITYVASTC